MLNDRKNSHDRLCNRNILDGGIIVKFLGAENPGHGNFLSWLFTTAVAVHVPVGNALVFLSLLGTKFVPQLGFFYFYFFSFFHFFV